MSFLVIGDPHFKVDNIPEVDIFIKKIVELATKTNPKYIICLGDLLHTHEKLHTTPMNKAFEFIRKLRDISPVYILVGNHDMCFSRNTSIMMWDGNTKYANEIKTGDVLMGDDGTERRVTRLTKGSSKMIDVIQTSGNNSANKTYSVTESHLLCLKSGKKYWDKTKNAWIVEWLNNKLEMNTREFLLSNYGDLNKNSLNMVASNFLNSLPNIEVPASELMKIKTDNIYGYKNIIDVTRHIMINKNIETRISLSPSKETSFFGWETDGNHKFILSDFTVVHNCNNTQFLNENHWMNAMKEWKNVTIVDKVIGIDDNSIVLCPYVSPGRFQEALNTSEINWKRAKCIFAHQEFFGCKMGAIVSSEGDKWPLNFPFIVSGHIHSNQRPQENIYYPGSAMQNAFGESDHNIILIFDPDTKNIKEVDLEMPRKKIVYKNIDDIDSFKEKEPDNKDQIKLTISGSYEEFKSFKKTQKYKKLIKDGTKVVFKPKKIEKITDAETVKTDEVQFLSVLLDLINKENDSYLTQTYNHVLFGK